MQYSVMFFGLDQFSRFFGNRDLLPRRFVLFSAGENLYPVSSGQHFALQRTTRDVVVSEVLSKDVPGAPVCYC